jgi:uncharacterized protein (TIGR03086 family)
MNNALRTRQRMFVLALPFAAALYIGAEGIDPKGTDQIVTTTAVALKEMALLRRACSEFERRLSRVTPDQLPRPSPCEEWTVRDLISHVVGESIMSVRLLRGADAEETVYGLDGDMLGADASAAFATAASAEREAFEECGATERIVHHPAMDMAGAQLLRFRIGGLTLHAWDLARGVGGDEILDAELVEAVWAQLSPMTPFIAQTGVFGVGPSGEVGEDAPLQARLLDLSGRRS